MPKSVLSGQCIVGAMSKSQTNGLEFVLTLSCPDKPGIVYVATRKDAEEAPRPTAICMLLWAPRLVPAVLQQQFRRTPDNQTATIGDTVTLACSVINKVGVLQWTRDGFGLGTDRNLNGYERYRMVGSEEEGETAGYG